MSNRLNGKETTMKPIHVLIWFLSLVQNVQTTVLMGERIKLLTAVSLNTNISIIHPDTHKIEIRKAHNSLQQTAKQGKSTPVVVNNPSFDDKHSYIAASNRSCITLPDASRNTTTDNPPVTRTKEFTKNPFTLNQEEDPNIMGEENKSSNTQPSAWRGGGQIGRAHV